ncbi:hypothetical protein ACQPZQ_28085 [Pseudonocardia sp. CA-142604]
MTSAVPGPRPLRSADEVSMSGSLRPDLEVFWPSRRGHAYDEQ